jgi:hypothetical protein
MKLNKRMKLNKSTDVMDAGTLLKIYNRHWIEHTLLYTVNSILFHEERTRLSKTTQQREIAKINIGFNLEQIRNCYIAINLLDEIECLHPRYEPTEVPIRFDNENFYPFINRIRVDHLL